MSNFISSPSTGANPLVSQWFDFGTPGQVMLLCGKVEIGQGIATALVQIAADTLDLAVARFVVCAGDTGKSPNEGYTAGSVSISVGGAAVKLAAASARRALLEAAARALDVGAARLAVSDGTVLLDSKPTALDYWRLASSVDWSQPIDVQASWDKSALGGLIGERVDRLDLPAKITGAAFVHDIELDGMLHGRVLRPPSFTARLLSADIDELGRRFPTVRVWRDGSFVGLVADDEWEVVKATEALRGLTEWEERDDLPRVESWAGYLEAQPAIVETTEAGQRLPSTENEQRISATYSRPPIAHASIAPSCAVATWEDDFLTIHGSSQGVFNLRNAIALGLGVSVDQVRIIHCLAAGCYGHNGSDDCAMDAALLARAFSPRPVRMQWSRRDELGWEPFGTAMAVRIEGATIGGEIADWSTELWSGTQCKRPGFEPGLVDLLGAVYLDPPVPMSDARNHLAAFVGCDRNSEPPYKSARLRVTRNKLPDLPFRFSSLRTLGGFTNVFAIECFMDELAERAGQDPVEFRLRHLEDPRGRGVLTAVAKMASWGRELSGEQTGALGVSYSRYKNTAAYVACVAEIAIGDQLQVTKMFTAVDAGLPINPNGLVNQIEGGVIQSVSWTLMEKVTFDSRSITSNSWGAYPILRCDQSPTVFVEIVDQGGNPPLGVGEAAQGPAAAAVANAVARATGIRVRDLPITQEAIIKAMN